MAYTHVQYGVMMNGQVVSGAAPTTWDLAIAAGVIPPTIGTRFGFGPHAGSFLATYAVGTYGCHQWQPACVPHRVVRVGLETDANLGSPQNLIFTVHPRSGSATGPAFTFSMPTTTATGLQTIKTVTNYVVVNPGQYLRTSVSTAISSVRGKVYLWVEPVWEEVANVTDAQSPTA